MREHFSEGVQPRYRIELMGIRMSSRDWVDITDLTNYPVSVSIEENMMAKATFSMTTWSPEILSRIRMGTKVRISGGTYDGTSTNFRVIFEGGLTRTNMRISNDGRIESRVEAISDMYQVGNKELRNFTYPSKTQPRNFCKGKTSVTLREIIEGIANDINFKIGEVSLPKSYENKKFTFRDPLVQKNITDWHFLQVLAKRYACSCTTIIEDGEEKLFFQHTAKLLQTFDVRSKIEFRVPTRKDTVNEHSALSGVGLGSAPLDNEKEWVHRNNPNWDRIRILRDVTLDEDLFMTHSISRSACWFDPEKGEYRDGISEVTKDGKIVFYDLDPEKVAYIRRTNPKLADDIMYNSPLDWRWKKDLNSDKPETDPRYVAYYYKQVLKCDANGPISVFDRAFRGIHLRGVCNLEMDVRVQSCYRINGLFKWSTGESVNTAYYLKGITHIWDAEGARTELEFLR